MKHGADMGIKRPSFFSGGCLELFYKIAACFMVENIDSDIQNIHLTVAYHQANQLFLFHMLNDLYNSAIINEC